MLAWAPKSQDTSIGNMHWRYADAVDSKRYMHPRESKQNRAGGSVVTDLRLAETVFSAQKRRSENPVVRN